MCSRTVTCLHIIRQAKSSCCWSWYCCIVFIVVAWAAYTLWFALFFLADIKHDPITYTRVNFWEMSSLSERQTKSSLLLLLLLLYYYILFFSYINWNYKDSYRFLAFILYVFVCVCVCTIHGHIYLLYLICIRNHIVDDCYIVLYVKWTRTICMVENIWGTRQFTVGWKNWCFWEFVCIELNTMMRRDHP